MVMVNVATGVGLGTGATGEGGGIGVGMGGPLGLPPQATARAASTGTTILRIIRLLVEMAMLRV
jgi:hypothetical protein